MYGMHLGNAKDTEKEPKMRTLLTRLRRFASEFVRNNIVDDEENLWPNLSSMERHELERELVRADAAN